MNRSPARAAPLLPSLPRRPALSLVAAGIALALGTFGIDAAALSLGRINVLSSLGEPLRAEVELTDVTAAEADGLRVRMVGSGHSFTPVAVTDGVLLRRRQRDRKRGQDLVAEDRVLGLRHRQVDPGGRHDRGERRAERDERPDARGSPFHARPNSAGSRP